MHVYFARHGEAECNLTREFSNTGRKHPLTARGVQQAHTLAAGLAGAGIGAIYASPLLRAQQTAQIVSEALGVAYATTDALLEFSVGELEGRADAPAWNRFRQVFDDWFERGRWDNRLPGGESIADMQARFMPFMAQLVERHASDPGAVLLISHGGLYCCVLPFLLENVGYAFVKDHSIPNTGRVLAEWQPGGWRCLDWCGEPLPEL